MPSGPVVPDFRRYRDEEEEEEEDEGELEYISESDSYDDDTRTFTRSPLRIVVPFSDARILKLVCIVYVTVKSSRSWHQFNHNNNHAILRKLMSYDTRLLADLLLLGQLLHYIFRRAFTSQV